MAKKKKETLYTTNEWDGPGKHNHYRNEYRQEGNIIEKIRVHRQKFFDGKENSWEKNETVLEIWEKGDPSIPGWLKKRIK